MSTITVATVGDQGSDRKIHRACCGHNVDEPQRLQRFESASTWVDLQEAVERNLGWIPGEWEAADCLTPYLTDGIKLSVYRVGRLGQWFIFDQSGEPVSLGYDTEAEAEADMTAGTF